MVKLFQNTALYYCHCAKINNKLYIRSKTKALAIKRFAKRCPHPMKIDYMAHHVHQT